MEKPEIIKIMPIKRLKAILSLIIILELSIIAVLCYIIIQSI